MASAVPDALLAELRGSDPDRYLATLWTPAAIRADIAALYACNAAISAVPDKVREPVAGEIRLQWWREVFEGKRDPSGEPRATAVLEVVRRHSLPRRALADLASAHVFDLYHDPMPDRATLEAWCGETHSVLFQLAALIAGAEPGRALADACGHAGCAQAIAALALHAGRSRAQGRCFLPADLLAAAGTSPGAFLGEPWGDAHAVAIEAFVALGRQHLAQASAAIPRLPASLRVAFLPLATASARLGLALRAGSGLFEAVPELSPLRRHWLIGRAALRGDPAA